MTLHPMQAAFRENHGLQCGFCTPGMIMTAVDIVNREGADVDEKTIREQLEGNICRCTGYHNIVKSIAAGCSRAWRLPETEFTDIATGPSDAIVPWLLTPTTRSSWMNKFSQFAAMVAFVGACLTGNPGSGRRRSESG